MAVTVSFCVPEICADKQTIYICPGKDGVPVYTDTRGKDCQVFIGGDDGGASHHAGSTKASSNLSSSEQISGSGIVHNELNVIHNESGLSHFLGKLSAPGSATLNGVTVYHFGDSHACSRTLSKSIAQVLQQRFGDGGGEFCSLKKPDSNNPSGTISPGLNDDANAEELSLLPYVSCVPIGGETDTLLSSLMQGFVQQNHGISYNTFGVSGKTIAYFSRSQAMLLQLGKYRPDLVIITLGTNDAFARLEYGDVLIHLTRLFSAIRAVAPTASILFTVPPDTFFRNGENNRYTQYVRQAIVDFCQKNGCAWWDLYGIMGGAGSMTEWREQGLGSRDRIHFTSDGYRLMGKMLADAIIDAFNRSATSKKR